MPKIGLKAPSKGSIDATATGITVVIATIRKVLQRLKP